MLDLSWERAEAASSLFARVAEARDADRIAAQRLLERFSQPVADASLPPAPEPAADQPSPSPSPCSSPRSHLPHVAAEPAPLDPPLPPPAVPAGPALSWSDSEAEDWAFGISADQAESLDAESRVRWEVIRGRCRARDHQTAVGLRVKAASRDAEPPPLNRHAVLPRLNQALLASTRRKLKTAPRKVADGCTSEAAKAVDLAASWTHRGSLWHRCMDMDLDAAGEFREAVVAKVSSFEPDGIAQRLRYLGKFLKWAAQQGVAEPAAAGADIVNRFLELQRSASTTAPRSHWNALKWASSYLFLGVDMGQVPRPRLAAAHASAEEGQAAPAPPDLMRRVDTLFRDTVSSGGEIPGLLAGVLAMISSWLRFRHLQRAFPIELTKHILWLYVARSKRPDASGTRRGYRIGMPRRSAMGADIGRFLWDRWHAAASSSDRPGPGLVRDADGELVSLRAFNSGVQRVLQLAQAVEDVKVVTSYSWRRGTDAVGEARGLDAHELAALGAWKPSAGTGSHAAPSIPLAYAGDRLAGAAAARITHIRVLRQTFLRTPACKVLSWPLFRQVIIEVDQHRIRQEVAAELLDNPTELELADGVVPGLSKLKAIVVIPERPSDVDAAPPPPEPYDAACDVHQSASEGAPSLSSLRDRDLACAWVIPRSSSGKLHIAVAGSTGPSGLRWRCCYKQRRVFSHPKAAGVGVKEGVTTCQLLNRNVCEACLQSLCPEARSTIENMRFS